MVVYSSEAWLTILISGAYWKFPLICGERLSRPHISSFRLGMMDFGSPDNQCDRPVAHVITIIDTVYYAVCPCTSQIVCVLSILWPRVTINYAVHNYYIMLYTILYVYIVYLFMLSVN